MLTVKPDGCNRPMDKSLHARELPFEEQKNVSVSRLILEL